MPIVWCSPTSFMTRVSRIVNVSVLYERETAKNLFRL